jgi:hypothetical protein
VWKAARSVVLIAKVAPLPAPRCECRAKWLARTDDRSGSETNMTDPKSDLRFSPNNGHAATTAAGRLCAIT